MINLLDGKKVKIEMDIGENEREVIINIQVKMTWRQEERKCYGG